MLLSKVTAPFKAKALPTRSAPVFIVMLLVARKFPSKEDAVPNVADEPICQKTLLAEAPFTKTIDAKLADVKVLPIRKTNCEFVLPSPSRVRAPVNPADESKK